MRDGELIVEKKKKKVCYCFLNQSQLEVLPPQVGLLSPLIPFLIFVMNKFVSSGIRVSQDVAIRPVKWAPYRLN